MSGDAGKAFVIRLIHFLRISLDIEKERCEKVHALCGTVRVRRGFRDVWLE